MTDNLTAITRFEVIDHTREGAEEGQTGRVYVSYFPRAVAVKVLIKDDGHTLQVVILNK